MNLGQPTRESVRESDPLTGRTILRLTSRGLINQTPTYHTNSGFTSDGEHLAFASIRDGATWVMRGDIETGDIVPVWHAPGMGDRNYIHRGIEMTLDGCDGLGLCGNRVCAAPRSRRAVFTCGRRMLAVDLFTFEETVLIDDIGEDRLQWLYYDDAGSTASAEATTPHLEPICLHGTQWRTIPGQYTHPHPLADPTERSIAFNRARGGRTDVCVVAV